MKFTNIMYYMISVNLAIIVFSSVGIWTTSVTSITLQSLLTAFGTGAVAFSVSLGGSAVFSKQINLERKITFGMLTALYISMTSITYSIIDSANVYVNEYFNISTFFLIIIGLVYIIGLIQMVVGGFKSYE